MQNYRPGDKICIFGKTVPTVPILYSQSYFPGFSRGAYTARALAGMLHKASSSDTGSAHPFSRLRVDRSPSQGQSRTDTFRLQALQED